VIRVAAALAARDDLHARPRRPRTAVLMPAARVPVPSPGTPAGMRRWEEERCRGERP